tara:strand:- start:817 stop:1035 length:219 start_codon:yes stop_codon:yes gene_type:complete
LAWKSSDDAVDPLKVVPSALPDVPLPVNVWPMSLKDSGCVVIDLHLPFALHSAAFKTKVKATDTGKQTAKGH